MNIQKTRPVTDRACLVVDILHCTGVNAGALAECTVYRKMGTGLLTGAVFFGFLFEIIMHRNAPCVTSITKIMLFSTLAGILRVPSNDNLFILCYNFYATSKPEMLPMKKENPSKVWFTDMRVPIGTSLQTKLIRLLQAADMGSIIFKNKFVAVKMHFGEQGNLAFLRPNYAKTVVEMIKSLGGKPFLTDCSTLYAGSRKNALEHLNTALENGFSPISTGCNIIIADGLKGTDETRVPVNGRYVKEAKIGTAIMDADIIVSLTHFKGHELTGFGGALKNLGMGCGSRAGKMEQHASGKPEVNQELCIGCGTCIQHCAQSAITIKDKKASINHLKCVGCGRCICACPANAAHSMFDASNKDLSCKIAEYALAVLQDRPHFHVSVATDMSPYCDCHGENDAPIIPDVGMFASFDPVALDRACIDAVNMQPAIKGSLIDERSRTHHDHFTDVHPTTDWRDCLEYAEKIGVGSGSYELIIVK
jgi:uncharacterized protein